MHCGCHGRRKVLSAHLKWYLLSISVPPTLKDADPTKISGQARGSCLAILKKAVLVEDGDGNLLLNETLNGRATRKLRS